MSVAPSMMAGSGRGLMITFTGFTGPAQFAALVSTTNKLPKPAVPHWTLTEVPLVGPTMVPLLTVHWYVEPAVPVTKYVSRLFSHVTTAPVTGMVSGSALIVTEIV